VREMECNGTWADGMNIHGQVCPTFVRARSCTTTTDEAPD
jgi:hypothetical protein